MLKYINKDIVLRFDPDSLEYLFLYEKSSYSLICELERHIEIPSAKATRTAEDNARLLKFGLEQAAAKRKLNEEVFGDSNYTGRIPQSVYAKENNIESESIIVGKQPIKLKKTTKLEKIDLGEKVDKADTNNLVVDLKLALSELFKVKGSNATVN
ncbi:hypothetical protein ACVW0P_004448 [Mucilaginibacter sp. UYNi724]